MPTLYTQAESNTRKTWFLIFLFLILIISIGWLFSYLLDSYAVLMVSVVLSVLMSVGSYWYSDKAVIKMSKAFPIGKEDHQELYRSVENLCITAGLPMPGIYMIDEPQPNAFTTGRNADHSVLVVTKGLLEKLDRTEVEGVVAHELSHIGNKDMLLGTVIVILVGVVAMLSDLFLRVSFWGGGGRRKQSSEGSAGIIILVLGIAAAILTPIVATLIRLAVSRKREFLADATGVLLTRYPEGLARALEKISKDQTPLKAANNSTSHLYISSPFKGNNAKNWLTKLYMTHPPVEERIRILREMG